MKHRIIQYIIIIAILSGITGGWFYFSSNAAQKVNSSRVNNLTSGLVGYWTFDGADMTATTVTDMAGNNDGTLAGTPTRTIGKVGQTLDFDAGDDYIDIGSPNLGTTSYSVCAWIYPDLVTGSHIVTQYTNLAEGQRLLFRIGGYDDGILDVADGNGSLVISSTVLSASRWYHACYTVEGITNNSIADDNFKMYIDGNLNNSNTANYNPSSGVSRMTIGSSPSFTNKFDGKIDEVRYYNRALSQSEITELYQQGQTKINASQDGKLESGLLAYYAMDGQDINWTANTIANRGSLVGTGTLLNMSQSITPDIGKSGQALNFDGSNDCINTNQDLDLLGDVTISAWVFRDTNTTRDYIASDQEPSVSVPWSFNFNSSANTLNFLQANGSNFVSTSTASAGQWNHVVAVRDYQNSRITFYINNAQDSVGWQSYAPVTLAANNSFAAIGCRGDLAGAGNAFDGKLDEVRIYNRVLSTSEITELYQQGQTKINASQAGKLTNGLVVHQTFDGNNMDWSQATAEARDVSGNNNHGDVTNMTNAKAAIGKFGQALNFDGVTDYVNMGDVNALDGQSYLTLSAWVKLNATGPYDEIIGKTLDYQNGFNMAMDTDTYPWAVSLGIGNSGVYGSYNITPSLSLTSSIGSWHLWTMVFDGTQTGNSNRLKFYYDSIQQTLEFYYDNIPASTPAVTSNLYIGKNTNQAPNAVIDEVRIYNRVLSPSEVTELYNLGR